MLDNLYLYNNRVGKATSTLNVDSLLYYGGILLFPTCKIDYIDMQHLILCRNARYLCEHVT